MTSFNGANLRIGALVFGTTPPPGEVGRTLTETLELVRLLESLGYTRVWFGEHHSPHMPWAFPDSMVSAGLARTARIHVGTGCILLTYRNAYQVASDFRLLATLFGSRVELGVGSGVAAREIEPILSPVRGADDPFAANLRELHGFLRAGYDSAEPFRGIRPAPVGGGAPDIWVMGGSMETAQLAASVGAKFCYALFGVTSPQDMSVLDAYYESPGRPHAHAVAIAGAWYEPRSNAAKLTKRPGDSSGYHRLDFVGDASAAAEYIQRVAHDYSARDVVVLNKAEQHRPAECWAKLADCLGMLTTAAVSSDHHREVAAPTASTALHDNIAGEPSQPQPTRAR